MKVEDRPYAGNWSEDFLNKYRTTRSWTPDAIVTFNGETTLPGCPTCNNQIDFSRFINSVNASGGLDGSNSCDIQLKIPWAYGDSVYKDGRFILTTGIEVFVYYRGFFQVKELALKADNIDLENGEILSAPDVEARPYYPVFHGVISSVSVDLADGAYSVSIGTRNMLSFWDNQQINTNAGYFAADPSMSRGSVNMKGHVYTGMTPHQIIYDLFLDAGGSAEGTSFALSKQSNIKARNSTGQQNYSLMMQYLQQRFQNGMYGLRMYGASGRMYTAVESRIVSRQGGGNNASNNQKVIQNSRKPYTGIKGQGVQLSRMIKAGMVAYEFDNATGGRLQRTVDSRILNKLEEDDEIGLSVLQMKPFVPNLGSFAQVNFFESTFETKKAIAGRVCEVTGYEFYQDMDGDLVFKPPMYNMDTSTDRVYNIFREDLISISYEHNEPEVTYVTMKGNHFRQFEGHGIDGEWGVKGVYVDYALVAKYGWKGSDFDSSYYNSAKQAYYAAAVELDKQNKNTEGCSVTIPLRPEMKPGYPVYVEENDCFYYVESVQHSFSYGGSCTTSLTLVCQRKKFLPPGNNHVKFSDDPARSVDLGRTELPEKFLYKRYDRTDEGRQINSQPNEDIAYKKVTGFPNVVMAFDHQNANPGMLFYEPDFHNIGRAGSIERERYLKMIVNEGLRLKILEADRDREPTATVQDGPWKLRVPKGDKVEWLPLGREPNDAPVAVIKKDKHGRLTSVRKVKASKSIKESRQRLGYLSIAGINTLDIEGASGRLAGEKAQKKIGAAKNAQKAKPLETAEQQRIAGEQQRIQEAVQKSSGKNNGSPQATILDLIEQIQEGMGRGDNSSPLQNLMSALQDRKTSFAPKAQGYFRYYSSSHPSPEHQGPDLETYNVDPEKDQPVLTFNDQTPDSVQDTVVKASIDGDGNTIIYGNNADARKQVVRGLMTRTMYSNGVEYVPTKDILSLSFQVTGNFTVTQVDGPKIRLDAIWHQSGSPVGNEYWGKVFNNVLRSFKHRLKEYPRKQIILAMFCPLNYEAERNKIESYKLPKTYQDFPPSKWDTPEAREHFSSDGVDVKRSGNDPQNVNDIAFKKADGSDLKSKANISRHIAQALVYKLREESKRVVSEAYDAETWVTYSVDKKNELIRKVKAHLGEVLFAGGRSLLPTTDGKQIERTKIEIKGEEKVITPIFPISDSKGYEVFGAYQYGRGLNAARGTLFDALLKQDPSRIFTAKELDEVMKQLDASSNGAEYRAKLKQLFINKLRALHKNDPTNLDRIAVGLRLDATPTKRTEENKLEPDFDAFASRMMTKSDEQVITNVPAALSQIYPTTEGNEVCECRLHNTDAMLLEGSLILDNFLEIENPLLRSVRSQTEKKAIEWKEHQAALRGENFQAMPSPRNPNDRGNNRLVQSIVDRGFVDGVVEAASETFEEAVDNMDASLQNLEDQADNLTDQDRVRIAKRERT